MSYDPNNIFACILRGEAPCVKVYEDDATLAIMDAMPQADGHVLVLPKEAAVTLLDASDEAARRCIVTVRKVAAAVQLATGAAGLTVGQFNGAAAGQTVPHLHFHIVPREPGVALRKHAGQMADPALLQAMAERITAQLV